MSKHYDNMFNSMFGKPIYVNVIDTVLKAKSNNYRFGKHKQFYKHKTVIDKENEFRSKLKKLRKPIDFDCVVYLKFKIKRASVRDVDNLIKSTLDILQPHVILNDKYVYLVIGEKEQIKNDQPEETEVVIWRKM